MKIKPTQYPKLQDPITPNDHVRCDMLRVLENEGYYFAKAEDFNTTWYSRGIEIGVYALFVGLLLILIGSGVLLLTWLGRVAFGG